MADDADFTFAGQSVTDALAAEGYTFAIQEIDGEGVMGASIQSDGRPGSDGERWISSTVPARTITVSYSLRVEGDISHESLVSQSEAETLLNGVLHSARLEELQFSHQEGFFRAGLSGIGKSFIMANVHHGTITFYCPQPFRYGDEVTTSPSVGTVSVNSNYYVEPVILWELSASVGAAWVEVDGVRLTIDTGISSGQQVRIDCARMETRIGGVLNVENIDGTYPRVRDGSTIETSPGGTLSLTYQERWI